MGICSKKARRRKSRPIRRSRRSISEASMAERSTAKNARAVLKIEDLQVFYGESHALQGISLTLESGVLSVVGRNGMGKSTLCNTNDRQKHARTNTNHNNGRENTALEPHEIHRLGIGYVPQGRRVWPS